MCFFLASLMTLQTLQLLAQSTKTQLKQAFDNPPNDAKPMMRWWWFGTAVEKPEILHELEQMKADGIGGVELAFVYPQVIDDPANGLVNQTFLSAAMLDGVHYAQSEARKLGLRVDVTMGSGWPYGGPSTTIEQAASHLRMIELAVPPHATSVPKFKLEQGESVLSISLVDGEPKHWQATTALVVPFSQTNSLQAAATSRTALIFLASPTGQVVKRAAVGAEGWVLDPFSHDAVATHLKAVGEPLINAFGVTPPYAVFSDSLEAYGADWTPTLPEEFRKRRGYDLLPHLPELVAGNTAAAEKVRHDWGETLTELVGENYLTQINTWAIANHTRFRSQTYGEPAVSFASQRLVALPEGEGPRWRAFSTLRWATSANHLFGNNVTSSEAFTWLHSPVFRATPLDMKAEADLHFLIGVNQLIDHGWPYSAPPVGEPGWSLYAAAVLNDHNPWHPVMPDVSRYIQRVSYLLRQGEPANQVALLLPTDDAWAAFSPGKVSVTDEMSRLITPELIAAILSAGYNIDFIDADTISRLGIHSAILLLPPTNRIPLATLQKIEEYTAGGGKTIAFGRAPSLDAEGQISPEITSLVHQLYDRSASTFVPDVAGLEAALHRAAAPDLQLSGAKDEIGFIRRKLSNADIYFLANTSNHPISAHAAFITSHKYGEQWDAGTGAVALCGGQVSAVDTALQLAPYESTIIVFSDTPSPQPAPVRTPALALDLSTDWSVTFPSLGKSVSEHTPTDWMADPATRFYSGVGVYQREFFVKSLPAGPAFLQVDGGVALNNPAPDAEAKTDAPHSSAGEIPNPLITLPGPGMKAWFDPPVREAAVVFLNGQRAGALWHPPYRLDVSRYLKPGANYLEIRVYNTAINAWAQQPPHNYKPLIAKYGDRFQMQDLNKVQPVPSGLLGSIHLTSGSSK